MVFQSESGWLFSGDGGVVFAGLVYFFNKPQKYLSPLRSAAAIADGVDIDLHSRVYLVTWRLYWSYCRLAVFSPVYPDKMDSVMGGNISIIAADT